MKSGSITLVLAISAIARPIDGEEALVRARLLATKLGSQLSEPAAVRPYKSVLPRGSQTQIGWSVTFPFHIFLLTMDGELISYADSAHRKSLQRRTDFEPTALPNETTAWERAIPLMRSLSPRVTDYVAESCRDLTYEGSTLTGCYELLIRERPNGLPVFGGGNFARVTLDRVDGKVVGTAFSTRFSHNSSDADISASDASRIAHQTISAFMPTLPENKRRPIPSQEALLASARLGYANDVVGWGVQANLPKHTLRLAYQFSLSSAVTIWVDAKNGQVLGGLDPSLQRPRAVTQVSKSPASTEPKQAKAKPKPEQTSSPWLWAIPAAGVALFLCVKARFLRAG